MLQHYACSRGHLTPLQRCSASQWKRGSTLASSPSSLASSLGHYRSFPWFGLSARLYSSAAHSELSKPNQSNLNQPLNQLILVGLTALLFIASQRRIDAL
jgi:hypothetical protein